MREHLDDKNYIRSSLTTPLIGRPVPNTFNVHWDSLAVAYLELIHIGVKDLSTKLAIALWLGGVYYAHRWENTWHDGVHQSPRPPPPDDDTLLRAYVRAAERLERLREGAKVQRLIQELISDDSTGELMQSWHNSPIFLSVFVALKTLDSNVPKGLQRWMSSESNVDERIRFYFGLGVVSYFGPMHEPVQQVLQEGEAIWGDSNAEDQIGPRIRQVIEQLVSNGGPIQLQ